ncbi:hypothetical protein N9L26_01510 [Candidatus Pacebacteria bacterium]|nr:hypothetical protein [Candidatus Paceibacterota bacterium]
MKRYFFSVAFFVFLGTPGSIAAFDVTGTSAYQLNENTYLYTIEFEYGYLNAEAWLPIFPSRSEQVTTAPALSYNLYSAGEQAVGEAQGIVLSDTKIKNNRYHIAKNKRETFTLVVVYESESEIKPELHVTEFSHVIQKDGETSIMQPSASQLLEYRATIF